MSEQPRCPSLKVQGRNSSQQTHPCCKAGISRAGLICRDRGTPCPLMDHRATANKETPMGSSSAATMETRVLSRDVSRGHLANSTKSAARAVGGFKKAAEKLVKLLSAVLMIRQVVSWLDSGHVCSTNNNRRQAID